MVHIYIYIILCYIILYHITSHHIRSYHIISYYILYYIILYYIILYICDYILDCICICILSLRFPPLLNPRHLNPRTGLATRAAAAVSVSRRRSREWRAACRCLRSCGASQGGCRCSSAGQDPHEHRTASWIYLPKTSINHRIQPVLLSNLAMGHPLIGGSEWKKMKKTPQKS